jgi:hypothetical protein
MELAMTARKRRSKPTAAERLREKTEPPKKPTPRPDEETTPAQEWGERIATGKAIARGGQKSGFVPGATEQK